MLRNISDHQQQHWIILYGTVQGVHWTEEDCIIKPLPGQGQSLGRSWGRDQIWWSIAGYGIIPWLRCCWMWSEEDAFYLSYRAGRAFIMQLFRFTHMASCDCAMWMQIIIMRWYEMWTPVLIVTKGKDVHLSRHVEVHVNIIGWFVKITATDYCDRKKLIII